MIELGAVFICATKISLVFSYQLMLIYIYIYMVERVNAD